MEALKPGDPGAVGRYRLSARLGGNGRLGTVFLGKSRDGGAVTIRLVRPDLAADRRFVERFRKTTDAVRRIDGLYLAHVLDADPDGTPPWLVAEYSPGITLDEAVRAHGPLPENALRALGTALSRALVAVHAAKVVHQGLAAGTVMLTPAGPQIIDLGLTALLGADASAALPAPEQATGGTVTPATDIFALAGVVCRAAGVAPYGDVDAAELAQRVLRTTPDLDGVPEDVADLLARCFARRPDARPTAAELAELFDGDDAAGTAWLPADVAVAVEAAARVKPPKAAKSAKSLATSGRQQGGTPGGHTAVGAEGSEGSDRADSAGRSAGSDTQGPADHRDDAVEDGSDNETVEVGVGVAVAAAVEDDDKTPPAPAVAPAAATPTVVARKPPEETQLVKPRKPTAAPTAAPQADSGGAAASGGAPAPGAAAASVAAAPTRVVPAPAPPRPGTPPRPTSPASPAALTDAPTPPTTTPPPRPAEAAPTVAAPRWSPAGPPVEDARPGFPASPPVPPVPAAGTAAPAPGAPHGIPATAPTKRQAIPAVWYAVIVLVGLTSAGLAVYRLLDSEWRDLQNPFMGFVLPGVSLVFGLAGLVVLALAVSDRRKAARDPQRM